MLWALVVWGCSGDTTPEAIGVEPGEELAGGETTVWEVSERSFSLSARNLDFERRGPFFTGNSLFNQAWVVAPASTEGRDGLGPVFNARSCSGCHFHDGRGHPPEDGEPMSQALVRLSVPGADGHPAPDPVYGGQLQPFGIPGVPGEGSATLRWVEVPGAYDDGEPWSLRRPELDMTGDLGPFAAGLMTSVRVAPQMIGLGLLEWIDEADLLAVEDPDDADGDGVSGRANRLGDAGRLGRFGWKANQPDLLEQTAGAFLGDMGITTALHPTQDCGAGQSACAAAPTGGEPEADDTALDRVSYYSHFLAVPARRDVAGVIEGKRLFHEAGCAACHVPSWTTGEAAEWPELSEQTIWPYTDLLLHDLGPDLADGRPDGEAGGQEWRTPPLWGIGLVPVVNGHDRLLHDGRARGVAEAILWHGGEAQAARDAF
ncbi:MAG TPA: di-heme oxidoredictase family protein, partial [Myxococcota bacterium]|nr:di-heme oxidoredictase family protein [Myxococcota bacterium]